MFYFPICDYNLRQENAKLNLRGKNATLGKAQNIGVLKCYRFTVTAGN